MWLTTDANDQMMMKMKMDSHLFTAIALSLQVVAHNRELHNTVLAIINERVQQRPGNDITVFL